MYTTGFISKDRELAIETSATINAAVHTQLKNQDVIGECVWNVRCAHNWIFKTVSVDLFRFSIFQFVIYWSFFLISWSLLFLIGYKTRRRRLCVFYFIFVASELHNLLWNYLKNCLYWFISMIYRHWNSIIIWHFLKS